MKNPAHIKAFGAFVKKLRNEKGWSQQDLADSADLPKRTIQRVELATNAPSLDTMVSITKAFEISFKELAVFEENMNF